MILVSDDREVWTVATQPRVLEWEGSDTVVVGGPGWREEIEAERIGWTVTGNETTYAVDLHHDGETTRSLTAAPVTADALVDGHRVAVAPTDDGFDLQIRQDGELVGTTPVPAPGDSAAVGDVVLHTERAEDADRVFAETGDSRVLIAVEETY